MLDHTKSCPICGEFVELVNRTCPNKPTNPSEKWVCKNIPHITGQFYVDKWNQEIEITSSEAIGIAAISDEG